MRCMYSVLIIPAILLFASVTWAFQWQVDPDHTEIRFEVNHILTSVSGRFNEFEGDVFFDPANPGNSKFDFTVKVKSINTSNGKRDNHLRSKDFFNADKYPEMAFKSSGVSKLKDNVFDLEGMMTIKDVTKEIKIRFEFFTPKPHPFVKDKQVGGFVTRFTIPRLVYNVGNGKFSKMGVVGDDVDVEIAMEALTKK